MLIIKENLRENCDKCISKAICFQICREELTNEEWVNYKEGI